MKVKVSKEYLKKKEILAAVSDKAKEITKGEVTHKTTEAVLEATADVVKEELKKDRKAVVPHIGTFFPKFEEAKTNKAVTIPGRNGQPTRKEYRDIPAKHKVGFTLEKSFKDAYHLEKSKVVKK